MSVKRLPLLAQEDYAALRAVADPKIIQDGGEYVITLDTGRLNLTARYRSTAPRFEDGTPDEDTRLSCLITVDGRQVPTPGRWSDVVALVINPDALTLGRIGAADVFRAERSANDGMTWTVDHPRLTGEQARAYIRTLAYASDGSVIPGTDTVTVRATHRRQHYTGRRWRIVRTIKES